MFYSFLVHDNKLQLLASYKLHARSRCCCFEDSAKEIWIWARLVTQPHSHCCVKKFPLFFKC